MCGPQASSALNLLSLVYHLCHALAAVDSPASPRLSHSVCPLKHERLLDIEIAGNWCMNRSRSVPICSRPRASMRHRLPCCCREENPSRRQPGRQDHALGKLEALKAVSHRMFIVKAWSKVLAAQRVSYKT